MRGQTAVVASASAAVRPKTLLALRLMACAAYGALNVAYAINPGTNLPSNMELFASPYSLCRRRFSPMKLEGAFGIVCAGVHRETGEVVAIKHIPRDSIEPHRLQAEVDLLRVAGQHRNVVNFCDLFSDEDEYYIVMGEGSRYLADRNWGSRGAQHCRANMYHLCSCPRKWRVNVHVT